MKLCVFQGTFNPIHNVHLDMAEYVKDNYNFDEILFIPAYRPPHKDYEEDFSKHRFNMVKLAISGEDFFKISDIEFKHERASYTYLTIKELYKIYDIEGKINFIIGTDAFKAIKSWYETDKLKNLIDFIVFPREDNFDIKELAELKADGYNFRVAGMKFEDVSSTEFREKIQAGESVKDLIPAKVAEYIKENDLYKD